MPVPAAPGAAFAPQALQVREVEPSVQSIQLDAKAGVPGHRVRIRPRDAEQRPGPGRAPRQRPVEVGGGRAVAYRPRRHCHTKLSSARLRL